MKGRKTDKGRLKENRGTGLKSNYKPWLKVHEFASTGRAHRIWGWINKRVYELMSDNELYFFLTIQFKDNVIDIREQFPLLPIEETIMIANELGIRHPACMGELKTMSTDFLVTYKENNIIKNVAFAIKPASELNKERTKQKLLIEKEYFKRKNIEWRIITENQIKKIKAKNLYSIYADYFWAEYKMLTNESINNLTILFIRMLMANQYKVLKTTCDFEQKTNLETGEGLSFFKYLLAHKVLLTDMDELFDFNTMKVWINERIVKNVFND